MKSLFSTLIFSTLIFFSQDAQAQKKKLPAPEPGHSEIWYALDVIQKKAPHLTEFVTSATVDTFFQPCPDQAVIEKVIETTRIDTLRDTVRVWLPSQSVVRLKKVYLQKTDTLETRDTIYIERRTFVPNSTQYVDNVLRVAFSLSALLIGILLWKFRNTLWKSN